MPLHTKRGGSDPEHALFFDPFEMRLWYLIVELTHGHRCGGHEAMVVTPLKEAMG